MLRKRAIPSLRQAIPDYAPAFALLLVVAWAFPANAGHAAHQMRGDGDHDARIDILYPCDEATVFDGDGAISVEIAVSPSLARLNGDRVELLLDGRAVKVPNGKGIVLSDLDNGPHSLRARLVDPAGNVVRYADPVRFYFWAESAQASSH